MIILKRNAADDGSRQAVEPLRQEPEAPRTTRPPGTANSRMRDSFESRAGKRFPPPAGLALDANECLPRNVRGAGGRQVAGLFALSMILVLALGSPEPACAWGGPKKDDSSTSRKLESLPRRTGERKVVTIYRFKSTVPEIGADNATDMFTTALIKSGAFLVAERQRLDEGVMREKQINAQGMTTGDAGERRLTGADYIFEGVITESNPDQSSTGVAGTYKGLGVEKSGRKGMIGLDVRVIDAGTGLVLDAVNVSTTVKEGGFSAKGLGSFFQKMTRKSLKGADAAISHDSKESIDKALRQCIEEAVYQLVKRYGE